MLLSCMSMERHAIQVVLDYVWGPPAEAALQAATVGARLVEIGQFAGEEISLAASTLRSHFLTVLGYATFHAPHEVQAAAYRRMAEFAGQGRLTVEVERVPLEEVERAWEHQRSGTRHKLVSIPSRCDRRK